MATNAVDPTPVESTPAQPQSIGAMFREALADPTPTPEPVAETVEEPVVEEKAAEEATEVEETESAETEEGDTAEGEEAEEEKAADKADPKKDAEKESDDKKGEDEDEDEPLKPDDLKFDEKDKKHKVTQAKFNRVMAYEAAVKEAGLTGPEDIQKITQRAQIAVGLETALLSGDDREFARVVNYLSREVDESGQAMHQFSARLPFLLSKLNPPALHAMVGAITPSFVSGLRDFAKSQKSEEDQQVYDATAEMLERYLIERKFMPAPKKGDEAPDPEKEALRRKVGDLTSRESQQVNAVANQEINTRADQLVEFALKPLRESLGEAELQNEKGSSKYADLKSFYETKIQNYIQQNPALLVDKQIAEGKFALNPSRENLTEVVNATVRMVEQAVKATKRAFLDNYTQKQIAASEKRIAKAQEAAKKVSPPASSKSIGAQQPTSLPRPAQGAEYLRQVLTKG